MGAVTETPPASGSTDARGAGWAIATETARGTGASGLASAAARWTIVLAWACIVASSALGGAFATAPLLAWLAHIVALLGVFALTDARDAPLLGARALAVPILAITSTALILISAPGTEAGWLVNFASYLTALQVARGNTVIGLSGAALQIVWVIGWSLVTAQPIAMTTAMLAIPVSAAVLSLIWRGVLRRIVARERAHRSEITASRRASAAANAAALRYAEEFSAIGAQVRPALERLRAGEPLSGDLVAEVAHLEASVRDRIRAPRFQQARVVSAAQRARERGVTVTMLADVADERTVGEAAAAQIARALDSAEAPANVTVSTSLRERSRVTVVIASPGDHRRLIITDDHTDEEA